MKIFKAAALALTLALFGALGGAASADEMASPWPEGAAPYIISPADGATVTSPVTVVFGLQGMGVAPAGVDKPKTGHHHLLIDTTLPSGDELNDPIPADEHFRHFGGGQTQATIELAPGQHTLQLLMGDMNHVPHNPPLASKVVTITVE